jgi:SARP family transcriptional regulator, regulator of embCAB operon
VRISICGRVLIEAESATLDGDDFPGRLGRRLWVYAVLNRRRPIGRDELVTALWGDAEPEAVDASLDALVSRLRSALARLHEPSLELRRSSGGYVLQLPANAFIDRERAWSAIHHVAQTRRRGDLRGAWAEAVIAREIVARGFLPGDAGAWIEAERRMLRDIEVQALEAIADAELAQSRPLEAERVARALVALEPLRESGYRLLMRALAASGNPAQAARVMEECRAALAAVSLAPSTETVRAFDDISDRAD